MARGRHPACGERSGAATRKEKKACFSDRELRRRAEAAFTEHIGNLVQSLGEIWPRRSCIDSQFFRARQSQSSLHCRLALPGHARLPRNLLLQARASNPKVRLWQV